MGKSLRKLDILAAASSGEAAKRVHEFFVGLREDAAAALLADGTIYHKNLDDGVNTPDASDLATLITLVNSLKYRIDPHIKSAGIQGFHAEASGESIDEPDAYDLTTATDLATGIKRDYNTHLTESGVHLNDDSTNTVTSADATDLATGITLANEIKEDFNIHIVGSMSTPAIELP